jgi:NhaA family Na+:H+ antiporter
MRLFSIPQRFLKLEAAGGILLFFAALAALILDNSPLTTFYQDLLKMTFGPSVEGFTHPQPFLFWINEGLMSVFFLLVGLELKREFLQGALHGAAKIVLPGMAACGGMLVPALLYLAVNYHHPDRVQGWAVPVATDIAFALGVLSLLGSRVPRSLKLFLMALAIFDDVGAILIIAFFYSHQLTILPLFFSALLISLLWIFNTLNIRLLLPYILVGILLWVCVLKSGIHPTVAGILLALMIPINKTSAEPASPLHRLEKFLHKWVAYLVLPLFGFANAGVSLRGVTSDILASPLVLGIVVGLCIGKQLGVFGMVGLMVRLGWAKLPAHTSWLALYGVALLCGIGFTMSLFLGTLAFQGSDPGYLVEVRLGVLFASIISGVVGATVLRVAFVRRV